MRGSRGKIVAVAWVTASLATAALAAGGSIAREVFSRPRADRSSTSIGVSISAEELAKLPGNRRSFDEVVFSIPGVQRSQVSAGRLPEDWRFDAATQSARGPEIPGGAFRLDVPIGWTPRKRLQIDLRFDGRSIWSDKVDIEVRDPIEVSHDVTQYLDLPQTVRAGSEIALPDGARNKWGADLSWDVGYKGTYRLAAGSSVDRSWAWDDKHVFSSSFYLTGLASYVDGGFRLFPVEDGHPVAEPRTRADWEALWPDRVGFFSPPPGPSGTRGSLTRTGLDFGPEDIVRPRIGVSGSWPTLSTPAYGRLYDRAEYSVPSDLDSSAIRLGAPRMIFEVRGLDPYGETVVQDYWNPVLLPPLWPDTRPSFTGITEVVAPHESFCVTGRVESLDQWNGLRLGGTSLGAPIFATNSSAVFLPPAGLDPGVHELSFVPRGEMDPDETGLSSAYITISARIEKKKIRTGGQTQLTLGILGTDRRFPVKLVNQSPSIINLEGQIEHHDMTTGGVDNRIEKTILGLTPGNYDIYYEVELPTCPGEAGDLQAADAGDTLVQALSDWSKSLEGGPSAAGSAATGTAPPDLSNPGFSLGGPLLEDRLWYWGAFGQRKVDSTPGCVAGSETLTLGGGRFQVKVDFRNLESPKGGACVDPGQDDTGLFYFFDRDSWEMLVKVLDGCSFNDHFWVFAGASTDVEYALTVTDTQTGTSRTYGNPLGQAAPAITDTAAFATCP